MDISPHSNTISTTTQATFKLIIELPYGMTQPKIIYASLNCLRSCILTLVFTQNFALRSGSMPTDLMNIQYKSSPSTSPLVSLHHLAATKFASRVL